MNLLCIICSIEQEAIEAVNDAQYIVNGQSVCHDHVTDVSVDHGSQSVAIQKPMTS